MISLKKKCLILSNALDRMNQSDFSDIIAELERQPLEINHYRVKTVDGRSHSFGVVYRRCLPADYSRQCWRRPYLYKLLLDFGSKHITIPYTSITVNQNYKTGPHRDKGNVGQSIVVAFGDYEGGELVIQEGPEEGTHDVKHKMIISDFSKATHYVKPWTGNRYSLVFYTAANIPKLPSPSVKYEGITKKWIFFRGEMRCNGLPHPLSGRKMKTREITYTTETKEVEMTFDR